MKAKMICYKLPMAILPARISVVIGREMLQNYMEKTGSQQDEFLLAMLHDPTKMGAFMSTSGGYYLMVLPEEWCHSTVYHEALHAATRMWYDVGADLEVPRNDEVLTYTMNYIVDFIEEVCYAD